MTLQTSLCFLMAILCLSCRSFSEKNSNVLEHENSYTICHDINAEVSAMSNGLPEENFRTVKRRESAILQDITAHLQARLDQMRQGVDPQAHDPLIGVCPGCDEAGVIAKKESYERQQERLSSCTYLSKDDAEREIIKSRDKEKVKAFIEEIKAIKNLQSLCVIAERTQIRQNGKVTCKQEIFSTACNRVAAGHAGENAENAVLVDYKSALMTCVGSLAGEQAAEAAQVFLTEVKSELDSGADLGHAIATVACKGGAGFLSDSLSSTKDVDYENACGALVNITRYKDRGRIASCLRTAKDACRAYIGQGGLDLKNVMPSSSDEKEKLLKDLQSAVDAGVCYSSPMSRRACQVISMAADQIKMAWTTKNNDWAHCLGTDQLGACIGSLVASDGWTNNNGVAVSQTKNGETTRDCCWCYKDYYEDDGWIKDTKYRTENWFGVIQEGDVQSGSCKAKESGQFSGDRESVRNGHKTYYRYSDCGKWRVSGESCQPSNGKIRVWNSEKSEWFDVRVP